MISGISIITCTNNHRFIDNLFRNYNNQIYPSKELIVILNKDTLNIVQYRNRARLLKNVSIYQLPEKTSLGHCLNFAIRRAKYNCIAKFDHDDYYAPYYVKRAMKDLNRKDVDVVGKRTHYLYLEGKKTLYVRFPNQENRYVRNVAGGTIMFKKKVFNHVKFANLSLGEDVQFLKQCRARGFRIYSSNKSNYVYIRRRNQNTHTWKTTNRYLLLDSKAMTSTVNFKRLVQHA